MAPRLGFEPRQADSESAVLPLHHLGMDCRVGTAPMRKGRARYELGRFCQQKDARRGRKVGACGGWVDRRLENRRSLGSTLVRSGMAEVDCGTGILACSVRRGWTASGGGPKMNQSPDLQINTRAEREVCRKQPAGRSRRRAENQPNTRSTDQQIHASTSRITCPCTSVRRRSMPLW